MSLYSIRTIKLASARRLVLFISSLEANSLCSGLTFQAKQSRYSSVDASCYLECPNFGSYRISGGYCQ